MAEKDLDEIRDKLYDLEMPVDGDLWQEVQSSMRRRRLRKAFYYAMSSAAVVAVAFMLLVNPQRRIKEVEILAAAAVAAYEKTLPQSAVMGTPAAHAVTEMAVPQASATAYIPQSTEQLEQPAPAKAKIGKKAAMPVAVAPVEEVADVQ